MPTAARLVAAICLAVTAYLVSRMIIPLMPESTDFGYFVPLNIALGLVVGWIAMGWRAGRGVVAGINNGLTGVAVLVFWGLAVQAAYEMFRLAMRNRYDGPFDAIVAIFRIGAEYALMIGTVEIVVFLVVAAVVSGLLTEVAGRMWR